MNKKGFTLVEVLVTIVIVALLGGIGVVSYQTFFKSGEEKYFDSLESNILLAGNDYFTDHRDELPTGNDFNEISLNDLVRQKYIEEVKDSKGNKCTEGKVYVYRENNKYVYEVCLDCGGYKSKGKYCNDEAITKTITISAETENTHTPYNATASYNSAAYTNNENVIVTFSMANYRVGKYTIENTTTGAKKSCNVGGGTSCNIKVTESGTYKVTAYDNDEVIATGQYINVKIARNGPKYTVNGETKYIISKEDCNSNKTKARISYTLVKDNINEEYKSIKYRINEGAYKEVNSLSITDELESGHYVIEIVVENFAGEKTITTRELDVGYLVDIEYDDDHSTATHEVVKGQNYDYLSELPRTKLAYGQTLDVRWHLNDVRFYPDEIVTNNCTYKIVGKMSIPVQVEDFATYCNTLSYTGSEQTLTKTPPTNVTFVNNKGTDAGEYTVIARIDTPQYIWQNGSNYDFADKEFKCTIQKSPAVVICNNKTYDGTEQTGCSCNGGTITGTYKATTVGTFNDVNCTPDNNHLAPTGNSSWTMNKKALTITAKAQSINYGSSIATGTSQVTASGLVSGDSLTGVTLTASTSSATTSGTITPSAATTTKGIGNYSVTYSKGNLTINKVKAVITCANKTYNGSAQTIATCAGGTVSGASKTNYNSSGYSITCAGDGNHTAADAKTCYINQRALTITAKAQSINYGSSIATGKDQVTASGLVSGDSLTGVTLTASTANVPGGTITPSAATTTKGIGNYSVTYTPGSLTINKVAATLSCSNQNHNGSAQTACTCSGGTLGGTYRATKIGQYTASCSPDGNHTAPNNATWRMIGTYTATYSGRSSSTTFSTTVTTGYISATASSGTASCSLSGKTLNCTVSGIRGSALTSKAQCVTYAGVSEDNVIWANNKCYAFASTGYRHITGAWPCGSETNPSQTGHCPEGDSICRGHTPCFGGGEQTGASCYGIAGATSCSVCKCYYYPDDNATQRLYNTTITVKYY